MDILYLIGNGFDLAQGLKTSYTDFYNYLKQQTPINSVFELMLKQIKGPEIELWKDMELALGQFTKNISDKNQFEEFYYALCEHLNVYLNAQQDAYVPDKGTIEKYIRDLVRPDWYLTEREKLQVKTFFLQYQETRNVNVVSFNYTNVFDRVLDMNNPEIVLPAEGYGYRLHPIVNIHGRLDQTYILMGVNDETQILNSDFAEDEDVGDYLIKPQSNYEIGTLVDENVENLISDSHLIVTMGLSFGETDSKWWNCIGKRLRKGGNILIIVFTYIKDLPTDPRRHQTICRSKRKEFLSRCGFAESEFDKYKDRIIVCPKEGLFSPRTYIFDDDRKGF